MKHGKLISETVIEYAPNSVHLNGVYYPSPTTTIYRLCDEGPFYPIYEQSRTSAPEGEHWVERIGWELYEPESIIYGIWRSEKNKTIYRAWTPLTIMRAAKNAGYWNDLKTILEQQNAMDEFITCQYIAECDPAYPAIYQMIKSVIGDTIDEFLNSLRIEKTGTKEDLLNMSSL